ncbi:sodium:solute symporter family protein [Bacillus andreraoultii]|uniref:sodium:solute symporter family protein n=1 Tax=Bacillus andreraoultii TaxID=1499685 RepID=UPI00053A27F4|nr:sodium:pantothenate symporter [Bacillus andreraoultii]
MNELERYVWSGVGLFVILMIGLGLYSSRGTKSISDFTIGGGKLGPVLLGLSFAATYLSAAVFLGYPGWSYQWGYANLWLLLGILGGGPLGAVLVAKHVRKINSKQKSLSLSDWLGDFYNSNILRIGTGLILLFNIFYIAGQFVAGARVFEYTLGISYKVALIFIAAIVILYVFIGGTLADVYTDAVQVFLMAIAGLIIFISGIVLFWEGSVTATFQEITAKLASQNQSYVTIFNSESTYFDSLSAVIGAFLIQMAFAVSAPQLFNKVLGLKNEKDIGKMIVVYVTTMVFCVIVLFGGLYSRAYLGDGIAVSDMALMEYIVQVFPAFMAAFMVIVILAAALSTTDGLFVSISTVFANDIFLKVIVKQGFLKINEDKAERIALHISRYSVLLTGILAYWIVLNPPKSMGDIIWIGISGVAAGTVGPVLYAVFGKDQASGRAAELSMIIGLVSYFILYFGGIEKSTMAAGAWATLIGIGVMFLFAKIIKIPTPDLEHGRTSSSS